MSTGVVDIELGQATVPIDLAPHQEAFVLVRVHGHPVGTVWIDVPDGVLDPAALSAAVAADRELMQRVVRRLALDHLLPAEAPPTLPTWSVAVCTRDRPALLAESLTALTQLKGTPNEVIVVDNASATDEAKQVAADFGVLYAREPTPGLNRARRLAAETATGELLLLTDDDVVVEPDWGVTMAREFVTPRVGAVTGLVLPRVLDTPAQRAFEHGGGFSRGFLRRVVDSSTLEPSAAGGLGAGASLGLRRRLVRELGLFDAEIDRGTPARTGGDTYAIYRVLRAGHRVVYTPDAVAWHFHRPTFEEMSETLADYSTGGYTWMLHALADHGDLSVLRTGVRWFRHHHLRRLRQSFRDSADGPARGLVLAELRGALAAPPAFVRTRSRR